MIKIANEIIRDGDENVRCLHDVNLTGSMCYLTDTVGYSMYCMFNFQIENVLLQMQTAYLHPDEMRLVDTQHITALPWHYWLSYVHPPQRKKEMVT